MTAPTAPPPPGVLSATLNNQLAQSRTNEDKQRAYNWYTARACQGLPSFGGRSVPQSSGRKETSPNAAANLDQLLHHLQGMRQQAGQSREDPRGFWFRSMVDRQRNGRDRGRNRGGMD